MAHYTGNNTEPFFSLERILKKWPLAKEQTLRHTWTYVLKGTVRWNRN